MPAVRRRVSDSPALARSVRLVGRVPHRQMAAFYSAADLFVLGSAHEGSRLFTHRGLCLRRRAGGHEHSVVSGDYRQGRYRRVVAAAATRPRALMPSSMRRAAIEPTSGGESSAISTPAFELARRRRTGAGDLSGCSSHSSRLSRGWMPSCRGRISAAGRRTLSLARAREWSEAVWSEAERLGPFPISRKQITCGLDLASRPVFVCGVHRSGTTLVRDLLDGHPALAVCRPKAASTPLIAIICPRPIDRHGVTS